MPAGKKGGRKKGAKNRPGKRAGARKRAPSQAELLERIIELEEQITTKLDVYTGLFAELVSKSKEIEQRKLPGELRRLARIVAAEDFDIHYSRYQSEMEVCLANSDSRNRRDLETAIDAAGRAYQHLLVAESSLVKSLAPVRELHRPIERDKGH